MQATAEVTPARGGSKVDVALDLQLSGAAAQYGRGMISDVTEILMRDFASRMQARIDAADRGVAVDPAAAASASGFSLGLRAMRLALGRVLARFFLPYRPRTS
jgi:hypothetical protein